MSEALLVAAVLVAVIVAVIVVVVVVSRKRPPVARIDAFRVGEPWRRFVMDAQQAKRRFDETMRRARSGPIHDRLQTIGQRIDEAVEECWQIAQHGDQLAAAIRALDVRRIRLELEDIYEDRRRQRHDPTADAELYRAQQAVEAQLASADRLTTVAVETENRLRLLNAKLDEAVARGIEIALTAVDVDQLGGVTNEIDNVVDELEALRQGVQEAARVSRGTPGTGPPQTA